MKVAAIDFETYYDKEVSIRVQGTVNYVRHPKFVAYMVSIVTSTGEEFVGRPEDFDFSCINGPEWIWISHNAAFDAEVYKSLQEKHPSEFPTPPLWECTSDLCAFHGLPRALAGAAFNLFNINPDKSVRDKMLGRMPEELTPAEMQELEKYALDDSRICLRFWQQLSPTWPEVERRVSRLSREMAWEGVPVDTQKIEGSILLLQRTIWEATQKIPWADDAAALSPKQLALKCREVGIPCPTSLAMDDEDCAKWEDQYGDQFPWVGAMRVVRRGNMLLKKLETMKRRTTPAGRMAYEIKYAGAHTLRWSGEGGFNCVTADHSVLTPEGWVSIRDWDPDKTPIMQALEDGTLEFVKGRKITTPHTGDIIEVSGARIRGSFTPNHRVLSLRRGAFHERPAESLLTKKVGYVPVAGNFVHANSPRTSAELQLIVAVSADGSVTEKGAISFGFRKQRKIDRLQKILTECNIAHSSQVGPNGVTYFSIKTLDRPDWLEKGISDWVLDLSPEQAQTVLAELSFWDGCPHQRNGATQYYTSRHSEALWVMTLAHLHGHSASLNTYRASAGNGRHNIYIKTSGITTEVRNGIGTCTVSRKPFDGLVYCPSVPSGAFLTLCDNRIHITGNCQNLPSKEMFGVDLRGCIKAPAGKKLIISDLSQIEPRCLALIIGDWEFLEKVSAGVSPYIVHARQTMGLGENEIWEGDDKRYKLAKIRVLGLGYGCGWNKFLAIAAQYEVLEAFDDPISEEDTSDFLAYLKKINDKTNLKLWENSSESDRIRFVNSWKVVTDFRITSPKIPQLWGHLDVELRRSAATGSDYEMELPGGTSQRYRRCRFSSTNNQRAQVVAEICKQGKITPQKFYGGLLTENLIQAFARNVFRDAMLRVHDAGFKTILHVHDELVCEVDADGAEEAAKEINRLMSISPDWCPRLPVGSKTKVSDVYTK